MPIKEVDKESGMIRYKKTKAESAAFDAEKRVKELELVVRELVTRVEDLESTIYRKEYIVKEVIYNFDGRDYKFDPEVHFS